MTKSISRYNPTEVKDYDYARGKERYINKYCELFGEEEHIFTDVRRKGKEGRCENWTDKENLLSAERAFKNIRIDRNIGIALGIKTSRGYTVTFDKESYGNVPDSLLNRIEKYAVCSWDSQSGGNNHLLTVTREAFEHLEQFKTKVWFTEGDKHDLEILTSGHAIVPPSRIDENHQYDNLKIDLQAPTLDLGSVEELLSHIPVSKRNEGDKSQTTDKQDEGENSNTIPQELPSDFNVNQYFSENIPGNDSYLERLNTMLQNQEVANLWYGNYQDRSKGELQLRSYIAWYFNADSTMVQYIFENELPNWRDSKLKYQENKYHAKDIINDVNKYINRPYYLTGLSFNLREQLSTQILKNETVTVKELHGSLIRTDNIENYDERSIQRALKMFSQLDLIERESDNTFRNKRIDEEYIEKLEELNKEYKPMNNQVNHE